MTEVQFTVKTFIDPEQLAKDVAIDPGNIDNSVIAQAPVYVYYANQRKLAQRQADAVKQLEKRVYAALSRDYRARMKETGERFTEAQVDSYILLHPAYIKMQGLVLDAVAESEIAASAMFAMNQKKDMLKTITRDENSGGGRTMQITSPGGAAQALVERMRAAQAAGQDSQS